MRGSPPKNPMRIGIDLDNTIICYDQLFGWLASQRSLIPPGSTWDKTLVRDHLRRTGREEAWTKLQGEAYGPAIRRATPFPGVIDFISHCRAQAIPVFIISHKTREPFIGPRHDLHAAAMGWLEKQGFFSASVGLSREDVFLEVSERDKLNRIRLQACTHFIDDLPEILSDVDFPQGIDRILFAPHAPASGEADGGARGVNRFSSWDRLPGLLFHEVLP